MPLGFMMTSLCTEYWQTLLAQAVCIGIGNACLFVPSVAILPQYFLKRRALANGIAASGSSFGGIIYPIVFRQLYPKIGFGWATRVLGFISLGTVLFSVAVMRVRVQPKQKRALFEIKAFKEPPYTLFCFGMFFGFIGESNSTNICMSHIPPLCRQYFLSHNHLHPTNHLTPTRLLRPLLLHPTLRDPDRHRR